MAAQRDSIRIFLVEDNPGDARLFTHYFEQSSFTRLTTSTEISHVEDIPTAREELDDDAYDVVFLDLGLPGSSGLTTLERFLDLDVSLPVIVLTGLDDRERAIEAIQAGAQDYLVKDDINGEAIARSLRYAIERFENGRELQERNERIEFFNSVLRHDLLNGMTVIRANAELLAEDLEGEAGERADTVLEWTDELIDLTEKVRHVLDTVATNDGTKRTPRDLSAVVRAQADRARSMDESVTVDVSVPDDVTVLADDLLDEVVGNVLTNAVEHSGPGETTIRIRMEPAGETVTLRIEDDGPGVPDERKEAIFERGESANGGSGFGLYFVRTMMDAYRGSVHVRDNHPSGSVFVFEFPTAADSFG